MLDKRLKRMEERVIKILPGDEGSNVLKAGRANVRPPVPGQGTNAHNSKKRAADEAFGPDLEDWAPSRLSKKSVQDQKGAQNKTLTKGSDKLPAKELQEHLAEVFFDCLYGQSYLLLHRPSFMRRLRAGTAPPVLVLAICAIAARFSTHPQITSEPAFLRGEEWAAPAREIVLKSYDQPSITILTVLLILGLHEFGTCQGGRSWMFGGMAMRMAYALQLHRELDYDPLGRKDDADPKLSATDREIRRRTMWACFFMDRFNSSGTDRPTCGDEENIKVQLPTKEFNFQNEIPGATETLDGESSYPTPPDTGQTINPKDNMGVASYMVRIIVLWGRVVKYLNLGGKEKDPFELWHPQSGFCDLKQQAEEFRASLPPEVEYNAENLANHAAQKLANQFLLLHISYQQVVLFLHRYAIPAMNPGIVSINGMPKDFTAAAAQVAVEAADQISDLISHASEHNLVAPFAGYCAFTSSTLHIWSTFSTQPGLQALGRRKLAVNVKYINKMKDYWGIFHFMGDNLKDIWKRHHEYASRKGSGADETSGAASNLFQYGDWFKQYPNGVSETDLKGRWAKVKDEGVAEAGSSQLSDPGRVDDFFDPMSPPVRAPPPNSKPKRKHSRSTAVVMRLHPPQVLPQGIPAEMLLQSMVSLPAQTPIAPSPFSPHTSQPLYSTLPPQSYDSSLLPNLDGNVMYDAYSQTSGPSIPSDNSSFQPLAMGDHSAGMWEHVMGDVNATQALGPMGSYMGDSQQSSAWFMPFNMPPPNGLLGDMKGGYGGFATEGNAGSGMGGVDGH
ncbi:MAG: hypothetical protein Q9181_004009 [Wetmoreana brouardii]